MIGHFTAWWLAIAHIRPMMIGICAPTHIHTRVLLWSSFASTVTHNQMGNFYQQRCIRTHVDRGLDATENVFITTPHGADVTVWREYVCGRYWQLYLSGNTSNMLMYIGRNHPDVSIIGARRKGNIYMWKQTWPKTLLKDLKAGTEVMSWVPHDLTCILHRPLVIDLLEGWALLPTELGPQGDHPP